MLQSVHVVSTVAGLSLQTEFLASLIQNLPGVVFWLLFLYVGKVNASKNRGKRAAERNNFQNKCNFFSQT